MFEHRFATHCWLLDDDDAASDVMLCRVDRRQGVNGDTAGLLAPGTSYFPAQRTLFHRELLGYVRMLQRRDVLQYVVVVDLLRSHSLDSLRELSRQPA